VTGCALDDLGEREVIRRVVARFESPPPPAGPGDDAAVIPAPDGRVVATTDLLVEGEHFRLDWSSPADVGAKAAVQNLADVAAMGARPTALLVGLAAPAGLSIEVAEGIADGLRAACAGTGAVVVGGDLVRGERLVLAVTALGDLAGRAPVLRSGARVGDAVVLAGRVGRSAAGLWLLETGQAGPGAGSRWPGLVAAHQRPDPPLTAGVALARLGATSMCDVSDGLVLDASSLAQASSVVLELDVGARGAGRRCRVAGRRRTARRGPARLGAGRRGGPRAARHRAAGSGRRRASGRCDPYGPRARCRPAGSGGTGRRRAGQSARRRLRPLRLRQGLATVRR